MDQLQPSASLTSTARVQHIGGKRSFSWLPLMAACKGPPHISSGPHNRECRRTVEILYSPLPFASLSINRPPRKKKAVEAVLRAMAMALQEKGATFAEEEEVSSLCDLPAAAAAAAVAEEDEFEFRISAAGGLLPSAAETEMCAADELFFQGQILPLRPSVSSDGGGGGFFASSRGPSRSRSRSESFDQYSAAILGLGLSSASRSNSSGSSCCISRSHSSNSHCSSGSEHPRPSLSNNFYAHPSPTPRVRARRRASAGRRSASSAPPGWSVLRLGVAKAPEIELFDIMSRRSNSAGGRTSGAEGEHAKRAPKATKSHRDVEKKTTASAWAAGRRFSCKCSPDAVEPVAVAKLPAANKDEMKSSKRGDGMRRSSRILEWLEELTIAKAATVC